MNGVKRRRKAQRRARRMHQKRDEKNFEERGHVCFNLLRISYILLGRIVFPERGGPANESHPQAGEPLK